MAILIVLGSIVAVGIFVAISVAFDSKRTQTATALAAERGYAYRPEKTVAPAGDFDLYDEGDYCEATDTFFREADPARVFLLTSTTVTDDVKDHRKNTSTKRHTCAVVPIGMTAPSTTIRREGITSKLGRAIGRRDIEIESPTFNDAYFVKSDDERFAVALLDHDLVAWFLDEAERGSRVEFEVRGGWLLCILGGKMDPAAMLDGLEWAQTVPSRFPTVLANLYPPTRSG